MRLQEFAGGYRVKTWASAGGRDGMGCGHGMEERDGPGRETGQGVSRDYLS